MKAIAAVVFGILFVGCVHSHGGDEDKIGRDLTIGKSLKSNRYANLYFSGQPQPGDFPDLKEQGFSTVINLRAGTEYDEGKEEVLVENLGMTYYNIPFSGGSELDDGFIEAVTQKIMKHRGEGKVLVHCSSGNRVGIYLGGHFYKDHKYSREESVEVAKKLGLTNPGALRKLEKYLATTASK